MLLPTTPAKASATVADDVPPCFVVPMHRMLGGGVGRLTWPDFIGATRDAIFPPPTATAAAAGGGSSSAASATSAAAALRAVFGAAGSPSPAPLVDLARPFDLLTRFLDDVGSAVEPLVADDNDTNSTTAADACDAAAMFSTSPGRASPAEQDWSQLPTHRLRASARVDWVLLAHLVGVLDLPMPGLPGFFPAPLAPDAKRFLSDGKAVKTAMQRLFGLATCGAADGDAADAASHVLLTGAGIAGRRGVNAVSAHRTVAAATTDDDDSDNDAIAAAPSPTADPQVPPTDDTAGPASAAAAATDKERLAEEDARTVLSVARHLCALVAATSLRAKLCILAAAPASPSRAGAAGSPPPPPAAVDPSVAPTPNATAATAAGAADESLDEVLLRALAAPLAASSSPAALAALERYVQLLLETRLVPYIATGLRQRAVAAADVFAPAVVAQWPAVASFLVPVATRLTSTAAGAADDDNDISGASAASPTATASAFRRAYKALISARCFSVGRAGDPVVVLPAVVAAAYKAARTSGRRSGNAVDDKGRNSGDADSATTTMKQPARPQPHAPAVSPQEQHTQRPTAAVPTPSPLPVAQQAPSSAAAGTPLAHATAVGGALHSSKAGAMPPLCAARPTSRPGGIPRPNPLRPAALTATAATSQHHGFLTSRSPNVAAVAKPPANYAPVAPYALRNAASLSPPCSPVVPATVSLGASPNQPFPPMAADAPMQQLTGAAPRRVLAGRSPSPPRRNRN